MLGYDEEHIVKGNEPNKRMKMVDWAENFLSIAYPSSVKKMIDQEGIEEPQSYIKAKMETKDGEKDVIMLVFEEIYTENMCYYDNFWAMALLMKH